jgi:hypothetical protein
MLNMADEDRHFSPGVFCTTNVTMNQRAYSRISRLLKKYRGRMSPEAARLRNPKRDALCAAISLEETMADVNYEVEGVRVVAHPNWGAIWAGMFTFVAIWSVFGTLGMAVFASAANPNTSEPTAGMSVGMAVWAIILTIIAMFVAGRVTGQLAGIANSRDGMVHGMVMFGLSIAAALVLFVIGGFNAFGTTPVQGATHSPYVLTAFADLGWMSFVALFLGWLAAMGGASTAHKEIAHRPLPQQQVRHA